MRSANIKTLNIFNKPYIQRVLKSIQLDFGTIYTFDVLLGQKQLS